MSDTIPILIYIYLFTNSTNSQPRVIIYLIYLKYEMRKINEILMMKVI